MRWRNSDASNKKYRRNRCEISSDLKALRFSVCWISRWTSVEWRWPSGMTVISFLVLGVELKVEYIDAGGGRVTGCCWNFISFGQEINRFSAATLWQAHLPLSSLVAQRSKRLPAMQETSVWSQGWEDPLRRKWQPTPVFLPGESYGRRSLVGYSPRGRKESDTTERLHFLSFSCVAGRFFASWATRVDTEVGAKYGYIAALNHHGDGPRLHSPNQKPGLVHQVRGVMQLCGSNYRSASNWQEDLWVRHLSSLMSWSSHVRNKQPFIYYSSFFYWYSIYFRYDKAV